MTYREKVLSELEKAKRGEYLVSVYKWEDLEALLVGVVRQVSETHFRLDNLSPDAEWEDDVDTIAIDEVYQLDSGTPYLHRLTTALEHSDRLTAPPVTPKVRSQEKKRTALKQANEGGHVARVSLKSDGRQDVLVYEVGEDFVEFAMVYESGEVESGSNVLPLKYVKWVQVGSRSQEIVELSMNPRGRRS